MWRTTLAEQLRRIAQRRRFSIRQNRRVDSMARMNWRRIDGRGPGESVSSAPTGRDERMRRLESILFLAREPLTSRKLSQYANLADATEARTLVRRLNELYDTSGRAFRVEEIAGWIPAIDAAKVRQMVEAVGTRSKRAARVRASDGDPCRGSVSSTDR